MSLYNNTITTDRQTLKWGNSRFTDIDNTLFKLILSNVLKLKITNLEPERTYQWVIKNQPMLPNSSSISADNFVTGPGITEVDIDIALADDFFVAGASYWFGLRDTGDQEKIQIKFEIGQNVVLATGLTVINNIVGGSWIRGGVPPDQTTNKFIAENSLNDDDNALSDNFEISTNEMVKTFVNNQVASDSALNLKIDENLNDLEDKTDARTNLSVYSKAETYTQGEVDSISNNLQSNINQKANTADLSTVATTGEYDDLLNKPDLSAFADVIPVNSFADLPATGEADKLYLTRDTGLLYKWNGVDYTQLTGKGAIWGEISGSLSNQTDLQNALNLKADTSSLGALASLNTVDTLQIDNDAITTDKIGNSQVTLSKIQNIGANQLIGRHSSGSGSPQTVGIDGGLEIQGSNLRVDNTVARINANNTFIGDNNFDNPVSGVDPTADTHLANRQYLTSNFLHLSIITATQNYRTRFTAHETWQSFKLKEEMESRFLSDEGVLPEVFIRPDFSLELNNPTSTSFFNGGVVDGSDGNIINGNVGETFTSNVGQRYIDFVSANNKVLATTYSQHYPIAYLNFWVKTKATLPSSQFLFNKANGSLRASIASNGAISLLGNTGGFDSAPSMVSVDTLYNIIIAYNLTDPTFYNSGGTVGGSGAIWLNGVRAVDGDNLNITPNTNPWQIGRNTNSLSAELYSFSLSDGTMTDDKALRIYHLQKLKYGF